MRSLLVGSAFAVLSLVGCGGASQDDATPIASASQAASTARPTPRRPVADLSCPQPRDCEQPSSKDFPGPLNSDGTAKRLRPALPVPPGRMLMLCYGDFGPQAMAGSLLGSEWWSWEAGGSFELGDRFDLRVIVHADGERTAAEMRYPTERDVADYRIVSRAEALAYLDEAVRDLEGEPNELLVSLRAGLIETRATIARCVR